MLTPKKNIAIVYGHDLKILNFITNKINECEKRGYRVQPKVLQSKVLRIKEGLIFKGLMELFKDIDAAIVLMTDDDFGISKKEFKKIESKLSSNNVELTEHLKSRARQNVVFELGYIIALVGEGNYRIFAKEHIEIPSDIQGRYLEKDFNDNNMSEIIEELIESNLGIEPKPSPINDSNYKIDYSDLEKISESTLNYFEKEYNQLNDDGDKLIYLFERIVFDSYYQKPDWWQEKYKILDSSLNKIQYGKKLLDEITRYMRSWRPPEQKNEDMIYNAANNLNKLLDQIEEFEPLNPIIKIVSYDYLGLACHKIGTLNNNYSKKDKINYLTIAKEAFLKTIQIADQFDDQRLPLWKGYATFNLARTLNDLNNLDSDEKQRNEWRKTFSEAIDVRESWTRKPYLLPVEIEEGLMTEYLHAKAERIKRAEKDNKNKLIEQFPYAVDINFIQQAKLEYKKWEHDPKQIRVRLATNLNESWKIINKRYNLSN